MIYFHPNALDTSDLDDPAKRLLHTMMAIGIEIGESDHHRVEAEELLRRADLPRESRSLMRSLLIECTKALGLLEPDADSDDDALEASCPVFQYVAQDHDEVIYRLWRPIYGLSASELQRLLPLHPHKFVPLLPTRATKASSSSNTRAGSAQGWPGSNEMIETSNSNRITLANAGGDDSDQPIELNEAVRTLWRLAHEDGDLGAEYWNSVINLLKSANSMRSELQKLRRTENASNA
ncbi:hypothetical protein ACNPPY_12950 [Achromobacter sp. AGC78]